MKLLHPRLTVAGAAVEVSIRNFVPIEAIADDRQQTGELRKDQRLMSFFEHLVQLRQQGVDLGAGFLDLVFVDQTRMARRLAQTQQRF